MDKLFALLIFIVVGVLFVVLVAANAQHATDAVTFLAGAALMAFVIMFIFFLAVSRG